METKLGIAVSTGVAFGPVLILDTEWFRIPNRHVAPADTQRELQRLRAALGAAASDLRDYQKTVGDRLGRHYGAIFDAHALLLEDPSLLAEIESLILDQSFAAEYAFSRVTRQYAKAFKELEGKLSLASRAADLQDIERRVLSHLLGERRETLRNLSEPVIVLAHDLTPSETAQFDAARVHGFATEAGGRTSHTAIIAAALEIPAVVGIGDFLADVANGDEAIVDGNRGLLIINPDEETKRQYESDRTTYFDSERKLDELRDLPAVTKDGVSIALFGNIEFPNEAKHAVERGADGIGLYRTEFLYLGHETHPSEVEQYAAYFEVLRALPPGSPFVIRTLDLGADKFGDLVAPSAPEQNPSLGLKSIRFCLKMLPLFKTQLRAILRASVHGSVRILFPMITTLKELRQCKLVLSEVKEDLDEQGVAYDPKLPVGTMIEVPAAAISAREFVREVDFLSIGTNDLVQYTLASDRTNEHVADLYCASDPAVLFLIQRVLDAAGENAKPVNVCGEMSGEPVYVPLLLGMGLRQFSVSPHHIPEIKRVIRAVSVSDARQIAEVALRMETATEVTNYLREQIRRLSPDAMM